MVYLHANYEELVANVSYGSHMPHLAYRLVYQDLIVPTTFGDFCNCELLGRKACQCRGPIGYASDCCLNCGMTTCTDVLICSSNNVASAFPDDDAYIGECLNNGSTKVFHHSVVMDLNCMELDDSSVPISICYRTVGWLILPQQIRDLAPERRNDWRDVSLAFQKLLCRPPDVRGNRPDGAENLSGTGLIS